MPRPCIAIALASEARPFLDAYGLKRNRHTRTVCFESDDLVLVQTGLGKLNAASILATVLQQLDDISGVVNVGIAGADQAIGTVVLGHRVLDRASQRQWYPHLPPSSRTLGCTTVTIDTVDAPDVSHYQSDKAFDMEASGIVVTAARWFDLSRVQFVKVISDNEQTDPEQLTRQDIHELIECARPLVSSLCQHFEHLDHSDGSQAFRQEIDEIVNSLCRRQRFSESERQLLSHEVRRHLARQRQTQ